jgi:dTDP-4-amino-4,6-dideoxygalactose transaminase
MSRTPNIIRGERSPLLTEAGSTLLGPPEREALSRAFDGWAAAGGREGGEVRELEAAIAAEVGVQHAIAVNSGTSALSLALAACGVGPGHEVLVPPYTFAATAHAVLHAGARPVFTDIDPLSLCIDPRAMERRVTPRTRAVIPVHIGGKPADMDGVRDVAARHDLVVVEDAAQAHGAAYRGRKVGGMGEAGAFSFGTKLVTGFRGGAVVTDDPDVAETCARLRYHGLDRREGRYVHREPGQHLTMTALQAAVLVPQVRHLGERFARRSANGAYLAARLGEVPGIHVAGPPTGSTSSYYMLEALYDPAVFAGLPREPLIDALAADGVPVSPAAVVEHPIYRNPSLEAFATDECPVTESVYPRLIVLGHLMQSLVLHGSTAVLDEIAERVAAIQRHAEQIVTLDARGGRVHTAAGSGAAR